MINWTEEDYEKFKTRRQGHKVAAANRSPKRTGTISSTAKRNKFGAQPTVIDDIWFPSKKEANRYAELIMLWKGGKILYFECQVKFELPAGIIYILDFLVTWPDGTIGFEDVKGMRTKVYKLKKLLFEWFYPFEITEL